jgi:hypothetical protein
MTIDQRYIVYEVLVEGEHLTTFEIFDRLKAKVITSFSKEADAEGYAAQLNREHQENWTDNTIQFPRLIAELEAVGAFTPEVMTDLQDAMDLERSDICELIDRAQRQWETIKDKTWL